MLAHDKDLEVQYQEGTKGPKTKKKRHQKKRIYKGYRNDFLSCLLDPGPDIVILDEGHIIKNQDSGVNMTVNLISSQRRLALTGTPMQNNLNEYYWMVNFCKPNLLGTLREYKNQYSETISRGQKLDATNHDVTLMKQYAGLLFTILKDTVHRKDEGILKAMLPKKTEIVVQMRLTSLQEKLYERYMETRGFGLDFITKTDKEMKRLDQDLMSAMRSNMKSGLFSDKLKLENLGFHSGVCERNRVETGFEMLKFKRFYDVKSNLLPYPVIPAPYGTQQRFRSDYRQFYLVQTVTLPILYKTLDFTQQTFFKKNTHTKF